jgi:adenylate kinase
MEKMLNLVLFGPPGAGKGTQSENIINKYGLVHLSTGDLLRSEIARGTDLGKKAKDIMDRGELVSDDIVIGMIESKLDANPNAKGFIFDGFPRTTAQAVALDDLLQRKGTGISAMIALEVNDAELTKRLLLRGKESGRPDDANEEVIKRRIHEYNVKTLPLKTYYTEQAKFHSINGIGTIDEIFKAITDRIIFINAEMDLTALESDIEHLDLTIKDFDVANDIAPELLLEIDAIKRAEAEEEEEEREVKGNKQKAEGRGQKAANGKQKAVGSKQKAASGKQKAGGSKQKAANGKQKAVGSKQKVKKKTVKKVAAKKPVKKTVKKTVKKKAAPKKAVKKPAPKKVKSKAKKKR